MANVEVPSSLKEEEEEEVVCCSAPGKVLVTGGYLVLESPNPGLVLTVNARFHSVIQPLLSKTTTSSSSSSSSSSSFSSSSASPANQTKVVVVSPQFKSTLEYSLQWDSVFSLHPLREGQRENKYVERAIIVALQCIKALQSSSSSSSSSSSIYSKLERGLLVHIVGDNQFYSLSHQLKRLGLPPTSASLASLPPFLEVQANLDSLGSSAALVASLTGALLAYFNVHNTDVSHNAAQLAHSAAQGKIGSGFDISSAVFGSQVYSRFRPEPIMPLLSKLEEGKLEDVSLLLSRWDNDRKDQSLPPGLALMLGDVGVGSNTPVLVRRVLEWRKSASPQVNETWDNLNKANKMVEEYFGTLHSLEKSNPESYKAALATCAELPADQWKAHGDVGACLDGLRQIFNTGVRQGMRSMGQQAGVELEPASQTRLADATMQVKGCLIAGVPGAGGFDAMFAIVLSPESGARVEEMWVNWTEASVLPLILHEEPLGLYQSAIPNGLILSTNIK